MDNPLRPNALVTFYSLERLNKQNLIFFGTVFFENAARFQIACVESRSHELKNIHYSRSGDGGLFPFQKIFAK